MNLKNTLIVIDGANALYRAHYGITSMGRPYLKNKEGTPTGALNTMMNMVAAVKKEYEKESLETVMVVALESKETTHREDQLKEYKSQRPPTPQEIKIQMGLMETLFPLMGWPCLRKNKYEADDILSSLAAFKFDDSLDPSQWRIVLVTSDKDSAACVHPGDETRPEVEVYNWNGKLRMNTQTVHDKFGVKPSQIPDYLALMGDSVDNIDGLDGVGPKTAAKWLARWETLPRLLENIETFKAEEKKWGPIVEKEKERLLKNLSLTTTHQDLNDEHWNADAFMNSKDTDWDKALEILNQLEMSKWWEQIQKMKDKTKKMKC